SSLFLTMLPPPPRSPLFPYTTLFRSRIPAVLPAIEQVGDVILRHLLALIIQRIPVVFHVVEPDFVGGAALGEQQDGGGDAGVGADRKSTRLNSSHRTISYAVFCLKKK